MVLNSQFVLMCRKASMHSIYLCVCVYVCVCVCVCMCVQTFVYVVCACVRSSVHPSVHPYVCACMHISACICACIHACMHSCVHVSRLFTFVYFQKAKILKILITLDSDICNGGITLRYVRLVSQPTPTHSSPRTLQRVH